MNPITIIAILVGSLLITSLTSIITYIMSTRKNRELKFLKQHSIENNDILLKKDEYIKRLQQNNKEKEHERVTLYKDYEKLKWQFEENDRVNKESVDNLQDIIDNHDKEMREQRESFDKLINTYITKKECITYVKQAHANGIKKLSNTTDYITEFKANL